MHLAEALTIYYKRSKGRITFSNGFSLNKLALAMWEHSEICNIDASILSKVLSGKRLFTSHQLSTFCKVLNIKHRDSEYLFYCLHKDQRLKGGAEFDIPFVASSGTHQFIEALMHRAGTLFWTGKTKDLYNVSDPMESYLQEYASTVYQHNPDDPLITAYQKLVHLRARSMISIASQDTIRHETRRIISAFRRYSNKDFAHLTAGYIASFEASAHRVRGLFPAPGNAAFDPKSAAMVKRYATKAVEALPPTDIEYLCSLRNIIDSSILLGEQDVFLEYLEFAKRIARMQPAANFLYAMHLTATVGKGLAVFGAGDPFALKEKMQKHFDRTLTGTKMFELSDLKTELETHVALGSKKDSHIVQKIQRALALADEESPRFRNVIIWLAEQL